MGALMGVPPLPPGLALAEAQANVPLAADQLVAKLWGDRQFDAQADRRRALLLTGAECAYCGRGHRDANCPGCGAPA